MHFLGGRGVDTMNRHKFKVVGLIVTVSIATSMLLSAMAIPAQNTNELNYYLVEFTEFPEQWMKNDVVQLGGELLEYRQQNTYLVRIDTSNAAVLVSQPYVAGVSVIRPGMKYDENLESLRGIVNLRVNVYSGSDLDHVIMDMKTFQVEISGVNTVSVNYILCTTDASLIPNIASLKNVSWIQQEFEKQTLMNLISSNTYMGHDTPQANGFAGAGVMAEVQDNGCDADAVVGAGNGHADLSNVVWTDGGVISGDHGTCTTGIMFGTGAGDSTAEGILPQGTGAFCSWNVNNALSIANLWNGNFNEGSAGMNGIAQTNSWWSGAVMTSYYDSYSNEIDQAAVDYPHVLTHWACGNSNFGVGPSTMSTESVSKNDISGGAIFHMDSATLSDDDWHNNGGGSTPSQGPAADGRQKPDLCGPFDWIHTTDEEPGGYVGGSYYDNFGGTSGATPNVCGSSCLVYDMYQDNYFDNNPAGNWPYSCTVKALMIANAYQYPIGVNGIYRGVEGWGTPDLEYMYNLGATYHVIEEYPQALDAGDSWSRGVYSDGVNPLKITLCWIDPAAPSGTGTGRALINNLNLRVVSPGGTVYWGNNGLYADIWSLSGTGANHWYDGAAPGPNYADNLNNVENVFIQTPTSGVWTVEVTGQTGDVSQGPQDFSVVASGAQDVSSMGTIDLDQAIYVLEDLATITVADLDLNVLPGTSETVLVNVDSTTEPGGESVLLTETGPDSSTFEGTLTLSATNGAGILWVSDADIVTATYNDADDGSGSPAVVTDTAVIDGDPPAPPAGLTVQWVDYSPSTVWQDDFEDGDASDWTATPGTGIGGVNTDTANSGIYSMFSGQGTHTWDTPVMDLSGVASVNLDVWVQQGGAFGGSENPDAGEDLQISYLNNAATWMALGTLAGADAAGTIYTPSYALPADAFHATFQVRFYQTGGSGAGFDFWHWDDPIVQATIPIIGSGPDNQLDWILSVDDGGGDNDVAVYNIYRANNEFGPWDGSAYIDSVPPGTDTYIDPGVGEFDGINWWYVVRAEDLMGNEEQNTNAVPEIPLGNVPPSIPVNPVPAHLSTGIGLNPTLSVDVSDPNGDSLDVSFYDASGPTLIGTDFGVPNGGTASFPWNGLSADTTYNWYAEAYDGEFTTGSATWQFTTLDMTPPAPPTGLTVEWWGETFVTLIDEDFATNPPGWTITHTAGTAWTWSAANQRMEHTYGYPNSGYLDSPTVDCSGLTGLTLEFWHYWQADWAGGTQDGYVRGSIDGGSSWPFLVDEFHHNAPPIEDAVKNYAIPWADGQSQVMIRFDIYNYDDWYWYIDDVLLTSTGGGTTDDNWLNWTLSADDGAGTNDVDHYNIYRALNAGGPWDAAAYIDSVPAGTDTYMDYGYGQPDGINWWYVVRAEDIWGNEELNTNAVPEIPVGDMPPTVTVDSPNGGEVHPADSLISIDWTALDDNPWGPTPNCWIYYDVDTNPGNGETLITSAVSAGASTYIWDSTGVPAGDYYIHIVVEDSIGQTGQDWSDSFFTILPPVYNIDLTGFGIGDWVFVSFPIEAMGDALTVFDDATWGDSQTNWDIAQWYDNVNKVWRTYSIYRPPSVNDMDVFDNSMGVWLHLTSNGGDEQLTVGTGNMPAGPVLINLYAGWNLVGYPSATPRLASATLPPEADLIAIYDGGQPYLILDVLPASTPMSEGNAFWVHVTADTVWMVMP
jgi:serine protease AprX